VLRDTVSARDLLRHCLATVAYRGGKTLRGAPDSFADFRVSEASRTPAQILAHVGDLFEWALSLSEGKQVWHDSKPLPWAQEVDRFFKTLSDFDNYLGASEPLHASPEQLFQGPVADALTHIGQIAMLRRLDGSPITGENYFQADIASGRVGKDQPAPKREC
jgi:hypothetical protein